VVQAGFLAGAEIAALAFARLARCEFARIEESDAMVLVVIADERDEIVLMDDFGAENLAILLAQLARLVGLQNDVRKLDRRCHPMPPLLRACNGRPRPSRIADIYAVTRVLGGRA
jgi:hypothetical protein